MSLLVWDVLLQAVREMDAFFESYASTGGTTTTLVDNKLPLLGFTTDDELRDGTIFFLGIPSLAETDKQTRRISAYTQATGTITWITAISPSTLTQINARYGFVSNRYPFGMMIAKLNQALHGLGYIGFITEIISTGVQEYVFADTNKIVSILSGDEGATEFDYQPVTQYRHFNGRLWFADPPPKNHSIRITTLGYHGGSTTLPGSSFDVSTDLGSQGIVDGSGNRISLDWAALATAVNLVRWRLQQSGARSRELTAQLNDLMVREANARARMLRPHPGHNIFPFDYPEW